MKRFFYIFKEVRDKLFKTPSNNVLMDGVDVEENALGLYLKNNFDGFVIYKPL
jgi:hypothetical protein